MRHALDIDIGREVATAMTAAWRRPAARLLIIAVQILAAIVFAVAFVAHEEPAYFWDWRAYYDRYQALGALAARENGDWLVALLGSIREADYNVAIVAPMLPVYGLFGASRLAYVTTIIILYLVPAAFIAAKLAARAEQRTGAPPQAWLLAAALFFWPLWFAALRGMPDVAGLVPLGLATRLAIETRYLTRASILQGMTFGVLVWLAFLLRRWYAYADVALETMCLVFALGAVARAGTAWSGTARAAAWAFTVNVLTVFALLLAFQGPLVVRIIGTSYADLYAAYQRPLPETAQLFLAQTGLACLAATALGIVRAALVRNTTILFMTALAAITACLFLRTQAPGIQHILPVCFWMFPVAVFGAMWPLRAAPPSRLRHAGILVVILAAFTTTFVPSASDLTVYARPILPWQTIHPLVLERPLAYRRLVGDIEALTKRSGATFAVFASSPHLSDSLLTSLAPTLRSAVVPIGDVDARDGLRLAAFEARFAIVTTRPALHLPPGTQRVVAIPNEMIFTGVGPGHAYDRVSGPYRLDADVEAFIYARARPFAASDRDALIRVMQAVYPEWQRDEDNRVR